MSTRRERNLPAVCIGTGLFLSMVVPAALAQGGDEDEHDVIIVYGEKTARSLQDTLASVGVVTAEAIEDKDIKDFRDAFRLMANVLDSDWLDSGFILRGVNSEGLTPGGTPLASLYIDGAEQSVHGARRGARGLWDVQQLEVYRGPQSTLSGRASLAGAIYLRTRDPTFEWDLNSKVTVASMDTREAAIAFGGPISGNTAFRISAEYAEFENDINYPSFVDFDRYDDFITDEYYQIRGKLLSKPAWLDGGQALLSYSYSYDKPVLRDLGGPGFGWQYSDYRGDLNAPYFTEMRYADSQSVSFEVDYPLSESIEFTSLTTLSTTDAKRPSINEGTPGETDVTVGYIDQSVFTQEFRLNGGDGNRQWLLGVYLASDASDTGLERTTPFSGGRLDYNTSSLDIDNYALFGEITYPFADRWSGVLGGRIDHQQQDTEVLVGRDHDDPNLTDTEANGSGDFSDTEFLPKLALMWDFTADQTLGLSYQRGFRPGGTRINTVSGEPYDFDAEYADTFEISYRSAFADGGIVLNTNVFRTDWKDQQVEVQQIPNDFTSTVVLNAGKSESTGAEIESQFTMGGNTSGFLSIGYVDTEFVEFDSTVGDLSGLPFPQAPEWTIAAGLDFEIPAGFFAGADVKYVDSYQSRDQQNAPIDIVGDYTVANVSAGYRTEHWVVTLFSDNVFDEEYFVFRDIIDFGGGNLFDCCATIGMGRVTGVSVRMDY